MRTFYAIAMAVILTLVLCGCGKKASGMPDKKTDIEPEISEEEADTGPVMTLTEEPSAEKEQPEENKIAQTDSFSFADLKNYEFYFSSGAGAWATVMSIKEDGSFTGQYSNSDMGTSGEEYPNGTVYQCDFTGRFTPPVRINEYTCSTQIAELKYEQEIGAEEIKDGTLYNYTDAYGLEDAENILIYLPGTPLAELTDEFKSWVGNAGLSEETELSSYALNNEVHQYGFYGYDVVESLKESITAFEGQAALLENSIENEPLTQTELNEKSQEMYLMWDSVLNHVWNVLKQTQDESTMAALTEEEREWIARKEEEISGIRQENEGGTILPLLENMKAADMTKDRVYELMELLQ